jgi:hypothetical protein
VERIIGEMRAFRLFLQFIAFVMFFLFIACTSTKFSSVWKDEAYQERPGKILVINAFKNPENRRLFEDDFVKELQDRRVDAVVSYTVMPDPVVSNKEAITALAKNVGADTVLINRPLGIRSDEASGAGVYGVYEDLFISTQTDIFDMKSNRMVLSASAETWIRQGEPYSKLIQAYVKDLANKMSRLGLF